MRLELAGRIPRPFPLLTLLTSAVDVDATLLVDAVLTNRTGFGFTDSSASPVSSFGRAARRA